MQKREKDISRVDERETTPSYSDAPKSAYDESSSQTI